MFEFLKRLLGIEDKLFGAQRSSQWPKLRKQFIEANPLCAVCGKKGEQIHHKIPVHADPTKELLIENLITLCENHHLWFGHLGSYYSYNKDVEADSKSFLEKIKNRP